MPVFNKRTISQKDLISSYKVFEQGTYPKKTTFLRSPDVPAKKDTVLL